MADTKIAWCDKVWNPVVGCTKIAAGCKNCYAERFACRLASMGQEKYTQVVKWAGGEKPPNSPVAYCQNPVAWNHEIFCDESSLKIPLKWRKPQRIFICSMGDLFHKKVPFAFIDRVFGSMFTADQHTYFLLTKRPKQARLYIEHLDEMCRESGDPYVWSQRPNDNIWHGVSISTQDDADRMIPELLQMPGNRFVSAEPMLEDIDFTGFKPWYGTYKENQEDRGIGWVIIGCESGPNRRPCKIEWVRSAVEQCQEAGVPCFVKQIEINGKVEHDMEKFPKDLRVQQKGAD